MRERERERASTGWEGQRERETQYSKQAPGSELSAQSLTWGSTPWTVGSLSEPDLDAQPTELPGLPRNSHIFDERSEFPLNIRHSVLSL